MSKRTSFLFFITLIVFLSSLSIGAYRVNTQEIEAEDDGLCLTCPSMNDDNLTNSLEDKSIGINVEELEKVKKAIKKKGAKWIAGETTVSRYTLEDQKKLVGAKFKSIPVEEERMAVPLGFESVGTFDWRDVDGVNWMTPVRDQEDCGSCWAFGTTGSMEALINIVHNDPDIDVDLSEQTLVSCSDAGDCSGGWPYRAYEYIRDVGIPDEACFPYEAANVPCDICPDWMERAWSISNYGWVSDIPEDIKWVLQNYGPLGVAMFAPKDFLYYMSGIYEPVYSSSEWNSTFPFGRYNHWVTLVGYDDTEGCWIVKNSWGTDWGSEGYGKIKYGVLERHDYIIAIISVEPLIPWIVSISVDPTFIGFGTLVQGESSESQDITITSTSNVNVDVSASVTGETTPGFYDDNLWLKVGDIQTDLAGFSCNILENMPPKVVGIILSVPRNAPTDLQEGTLVFWAEESP